MASWEERHDDARAHMLPFLERVVGLSGRRVLELGAGRGPATHGSHAVTSTAWETLHLTQDDAWLELPAAGAAELHLGIEHRPGGTEPPIDHGRRPPRHVAVPASQRTRYTMVALDGDDAPARVTAAAGTELSFVGLRATSRD